MYLGEYQHTLDAKGRMTLPARLREGLEEGLVITRSVDTCLTVHPLAQWKAFAEKVALTPVSSELARRYRRVIFGGAQEVSLDKMGRMLLPAFLREYAEINDEVIIVGADDYVEIWAPDKWTLERAEDTSRKAEMEAEMSRLGI
jgi:MraZ protein